MNRWILPWAGLICAAGAHAQGWLPAFQTWGVQGGLLFPQNGDLRSTTGSGPHLSVGVHGTWAFDTAGRHLLRPRMDAGFFQNADRAIDLPGYSQSLRTRVSNLAAGAEYLFRFPGDRPFAVGAGLYEIRWSVKSTNRIQFPEGAAVQTGTSHWIRPGHGVVAAWRPARAWEVEARLMATHYGYENHSIHVASLGVLWHF